MRKLNEFAIVEVEAGVQLVMSDLEHCSQSLQKERNSPKEIRRLFREFLVLSQQLTEIMRKEFKTKTGRDWNAVDFTGWNEVTTLFKKLRREDFHQIPAIIGVFDAQTFNIADAFGTKEDIGKLEFRGTWLMSNQNSVVVPSPPTITVGDPVTGIPTQIKLQPIARHFNYHLLPRTREISLALEATGTPDIHALVHRCYRVLLEYGDFYSARLKDAVRA